MQVRKDVSISHHVGSVKQDFCFDMPRGSALVGRLLMQCGKYGTGCVMWHNWVFGTAVSSFLHTWPILTNKAINS